ncbi:MAG: diguanylate cyclase [Erysipelotrichaceae bacterium]|nr:diguanylate cyclase [Erysipelotrichaceae bacterium]
MIDSTIIPIIAVSCYSFLLLAFLAAKKNPAINSFIAFLVIFTLWCGGSLLMRTQYLGMVKFWYDISLFGIVMAPYVLLKFVKNLVGMKSTMLDYILLGLCLILMAINTYNGMFLASPTPTVIANKTVFIYETTWLVVFFFIVTGAIIANILLILFGKNHSDNTPISALNPVKLGLLILFLGNVLTVVPFIQGFPIDILSSIVFVFILFYTLYKNKLFKLDLLISKWVIYGFSGLISFIVLLNSTSALERLLDQILLVPKDNQIIIIAVLFTLFAFVLYRFLELFINRIYISDDTIRTNILKEFKNNAFSSLQVKEISRLIVNVIKDALGLKEIYILLPDEKKDYFKVVATSNPLNQIDFRLELNNPLVTLLNNTGDCILLDDLKKLNAYKSMWTEEKKELAYLNIEYFVPLIDDDKLVGIFMLTHKNKSSKFTDDDIVFLENISLISSTALSKAQLYEVVYNEARKDDLTKLLNRKYFLAALKDLDKKRHDGLLSIAIFNIDDFKLYNQLYGYNEGDNVLIEVARILKANMEGIGICARYDSKVFACVFPNYDVNQTRLIAQKISKQINQINSKRENYKMKRITVSVGISTIPFLANNTTELINDAELAIYHVKRSGKDSIRISTGQVVKRNENPDEEVEHKAEIYSEYAAMIHALTAAIDTKDHYTYSHSNNVCYYATELAYGLNMDKDSIEIIKEAALLHDIGKIGIDEKILNKNGRLSDEERMIMQTHVENSVAIIKHIPSLTYVIPAVIGHHERWDGNGYPRKVRGHDIPLFARILCIADSFDAMLSKRSYKEVRPLEFALKEIEKNAGTQFDPELAVIFAELVRKQKIVPVIEIES